MLGALRKSRMSGFTLVELMVVVIIIGILAAAAVPIYTAQTRRAKTSEALAGLGAIRSAERVYKTENGITKPQVMTLNRFAEILGVDPEVLKQELHDWRTELAEKDAYQIIEDSLKAEKEAANDTPA